MLPRTQARSRRAPQAHPKGISKSYVAPPQPLDRNFLKTPTAKIPSRVILFDNSPWSSSPSLYMDPWPTFASPPPPPSYPSMDMGDTSSTLAEWAQLYQHGLGSQPVATPAASPRVSAVADSTVVTTTSSPVIAGSSTSPTSHAAIEGRVGKSARRRSRASRRAPTTLLNTDTTNFRAMVQQFTGIPSGTYSSSYQPAGNRQMTSFGLSFNDPTRQAATVMPFGHLQHHQYQGQAFQHQHQGRPQQQQQQQQQIYDGNMFTVASNHESNDGIFLQGFSNPRGNLEVTDGFFLEGISSHMMPRAASADNRTHGFFS